MAYHDDVWELTDRGLMYACVLISRHHLFQVLSLSDWERAFLSECPTKFASFGQISWKQRKSAREILTKIIHELERRKELGEWINEAKGLQETGVAGAHDDPGTTDAPTTGTPQSTS